MQGAADFSLCSLTRGTHLKTASPARGSPELFAPIFFHYFISYIKESAIMSNRMFYYKYLITMGAFEVPATSGHRLEPSKAPQPLAITSLYGLFATAQTLSNDG